MTAMASPNKNNSDDVITKSIPKGKIGRSMNVNFVIKNNSGGDWEDVYVGIEDADFSMAKPDAIEGDYVFPFEITQNTFEPTRIGKVKAEAERNVSSRSF